MVFFTVGEAADQMQVRRRFLRLAGARVLARLLWGLAYQRHPQTIVLLDRPQPDPDPFDAEPSVPATLQALRRMLPLRMLAERDDVAPTVARATRVAEVSGLLGHVAEPDLLRRWAVEVAMLGDWMHRGMDCSYLDDGRRWARDIGEVQVFADYRARVIAARVARAEVLARSVAPTDPAQIREAVWRHGAAVPARRRA